MFNKLKKRKIYYGSLKGFYLYGTLEDKKYFIRNYKAEKQLIKLIKERMSEGNIYDIGAYYGFYSLLFARLLKEGKVFAFEPNLYSWHKLKKTIEFNNLVSKVKIFNFGLGREEKTEKMMVLSNRLGRSTCDKELKEHYKNQGYETKETNIEIKALDDLKLDQPSLVKIDVEGFEINVIKGMRGTIRKYLPDLIIEIHGKDQATGERNIRQILNLLKDFNYYGLHIESGALLEDLNNLPTGGHLYLSANKIK